MSTELIPFQIETQRVIQLLAKQIYQSPLALLRENTQNAFDAVRQRMHLGHQFEPRIDVTLTPECIVISDNGIGMTAEDLQKHFWTAGSSSKNNDQARAAGVVGTFGIGAMANFGIADILTVETESATGNQRTLCKAEKAKLSLTESCIEKENLKPTGLPGTVITAHVSPESHINVQQGTAYIAEFVSLVEIPVYVNDVLVSQGAIETLVPQIPETWRFENNEQKIGERLTAKICFVISNNAEIWISLTSLRWSGISLQGRITVRSGHPVLNTFRSGFGLATASVSSFYQFGGVADLLILEPTAGREALTVDGLQILQSMITELDAYTSALLATRDECDASTPFLNWVLAHSRYDFCGRLKMSISPGERIKLSDVVTLTKERPMMLYEDNDTGIIDMHASEDTPLLVLARSNPRRRCEKNFLNQFARVSLISNSPVVSNRRSQSDFSIAESTLAYRIETILEADYFLKSVVEFGNISHDLPVLVTKADDAVNIVLNPAGQTMRIIFGLYETEFSSFVSMAKDFVRTLIFPRVADYVPSSTRQGAEAFLQSIRRPRELFEYADDDLGNLPKIWEDYGDGLITMEQAVERSKTAVRTSVQFVESAASALEVVPDVIQNEQALQSEDSEKLANLDATPGITRLEVSTNAKLLVIDDKQPALRGYRCFLAITDKVREEMGEFFLQPHRTSVVWGGQKTLFIFMHHSGQFGLYYDLQTREPVNAEAGGGPFPTATIVVKNRIFIAIPDSIRESFVPVAGEKKRFEVRADILRTDTLNS